jgi:hypothetical protein
VQASTIILKKNNPYFPFWAIEKFWSPFDNVGVSNGNQNSSVSIQGLRVC